jgi:hypothetical protein
MVTIRLFFHLYLFTILLDRMDLSPSDQLFLQWIAKLDAAEGRTANAG